MNAGCDVLYVVRVVWSPTRESTALFVDESVALAYADGRRCYIEVNGYDARVEVSLTDRDRVLGPSLGKN